MTIAIAQPKTYTITEYLNLEIESELRSEYRNGEIIPMTGGTPTHNEINGNLIVTLKLALKGKPYRSFVTDQRLSIPDRNLYTYPDVMVTASPVELQPGRTDTIVNPLFIAEVLSKSTKSYDRDEKFAAYRTIETFQEYLLIDQYCPQVEQYVKQGLNQWLFTEYKGLDAEISLASIPVKIYLSDLYENIEF